MLPGRLLPFFTGIALAVGAGPAAAATLFVTTGQDETTAGDGSCSLREAIAAIDSPGSANGDCAPAGSVPTRSCSVPKPTSSAT